MRRLKLLAPYLQKALRDPRWAVRALHFSARLMRHGGLRSVKRHIVQRQEHRRDYAAWVQHYDTLGPAEREEIRRRGETLAHRPLISVVMPVYDPPLDFLDEAIRSVRGQLYPNWELCIADDCSRNPAVRQILERHAAEDKRVRVVFRPKNGHISRASNDALEIARGEFIALLDHDDLLTEHALFWMADAINRHPEAGIIYSDEDKLSPAGQRCDPYFKSDWNPELFLGHNLISHLGVYRTELVRSQGGFRTGYEGSQDYDLAARCIEQLKPEQIVHVPRILYHWRIIPGSTAGSIDGKPYALVASEKALNDHLQRRGIKGKVTALPSGVHRVAYELPEPAPLVSIIIPTRNAEALVRTCIDSILEKSSYRNFEILLVDNGSDDGKALAYFAQLAQKPGIRVIRDDSPFNYSALNNAAVAQSRGEIVALLNNDVEVITPAWLEEMVGIALQPGVGAVGARLWYPNDTLQHGGVVVGLGGVACHAHKGLPRKAPGYCFRADLLQSFTAVTGACLVIRKDRFLEVGGLNEKDLTVAFNDVDLCLKLAEKGLRNVWTPHAELYHHESITRGQDDTPEKAARFKKEINYMQERWAKWIAHDPAYNPNLTIGAEDFSLAWPPRVPRLLPEGGLTQ